jgi:hypothetical protein
MVIMAGVTKAPSSDSTTSAGTSLWTTPASPAAGPLKEASVDTSVSAEKVRAAVEAAKGRVATFSGRVTEELLRKSF